MKQRSGLIFFVLCIFCGSSLLRAQWVKTNGPSQVTCLGVSWSKDTVLAGTADSGIFLSVNGGASWIRMNKGFPDSTFIFSVAARDPLVCTLSAIYVAKYPDLTWTKLIDSTTFGHVRTPLTYIGGTGFCCVSTDSGILRIQGINWDLTKTPYKIHSITNCSGVLLAGTDARILRSADGGNNWTVIDSSPTGILQIVADGSNVLANNGEIFWSHDRGINWFHGAEVIPGGTARGNLLAVQGNLFMVSNNGQGFPYTFFRSSNAGASWDTTSFFDNFGNRYYDQIALIGTDMFVCFSHGFVKSSDSGNTWITVDNVNFDTLVMTSNALITGYVQGIWRDSNSALGVSQTLSQARPSANCYPNPFFEKTEIRFITTERSFAQVLIVNLLGAEVARLFSGELEAGEHSFIWDASGMPAGMYQCVVRINGRMERLPVVVVR